MEVLDPLLGVMLQRLSEDEIRDIFSSAASPLEPATLVAFSSTCRFIRLAVAIEVTQLQVLFLAACELCAKVGTTRAALLEATGETIGRPTGVFGAKQLNGEDCTVLAQIMRSRALNHVRCLWFRGNPFGGAGVVALAGAFSAGAMPKLVTVNFADCSVGDVGAVALADAMEKGALANVKTLHLCDCSISDQGVVALCNAFSAGALPACEMLNLSHAPDEIGEVGVAALAEVLAVPVEFDVLPAIAELVLPGYCFMGWESEACEALVSACSDRGIELIEM